MITCCAWEAICKARLRVAAHVWPSLLPTSIPPQPVRHQVELVAVVDRLESDSSGMLITRPLRLMICKRALDRWLTRALFWRFTAPERWKSSGAPLQRQAGEAPG